MLKGFAVTNDTDTYINDFKNEVKIFCELRDWTQFHNAKELTIGMVTEASELLQHFRFKTEGQIDEMFDDTKLREKITEEISDVLFFIFRLSQLYNIDLSTEFKKKMSKNEQKYPLHKSKGSNKRYSELQDVSL